MKKLLFLVALASILPFQGFSQFKLTINGFVSDKDETKNYVVLEADGVDKGHSM